MPIPHRINRAGQLSSPIHASTTPYAQRLTSSHSPSASAIATAPGPLAFGSSSSLTMYCGQPNFLQLHRMSELEDGRLVVLTSGK